MDATVRFWRDLLGLRLIATFGGPGDRQYFFELTECDMIAFFEWPDVEPAIEKDAGRMVSGPFVFDHVCLGMDSAESLWALKDRLDAAGIWVSEMLDNGFIHSIFTFDPNGITLEFSCPVDSEDIRKTQAFLDTAPTTSAQEGPWPNPGYWPETKHPTLPEERKIYMGMIGRYFRKMRS